MKAPPRLMNSTGPAGELMKGAVLHVPPRSRQRALQFTSAVLGSTVSGTALAAGAGSLVKSVVLSVSLGALGGGIASLAISETFSRFDDVKAEVKPLPVRQPNVRRPASPGAVTPEAPRLEPPALDVLPSAAGDVESPGGATLSEGSQPEARPAPSKSRSAKALEASGSTESGVAVGSPAPRQSLIEEQRVIEAARSAVARGDAGGALATLDGYQRAYANGQFGPEALALRVQALSAAGQASRARLLAEEFEAKYPHHPLLGRVRSVVGR